MIVRTTGNYNPRFKPNKLYIIAEMKLQFQSLISILTTCFDFLKNSEPLTQFKIYFMSQFSLTVPGVSTYPRCPQVTDALGLFLCPRFLFKFTVIYNTCGRRHQITIFVPQVFGCGGILYYTVENLSLIHI